MACWNSMSEFFWVLSGSVVINIFYTRIMALRSRMAHLVAHLLAHLVAHLVCRCICCRSGWLRTSCFFANFIRSRSCRSSGRCAIWCWDSWSCGLLNAGILCERMSIKRYECLSLCIALICSFTWNDTSKS